MSDTAPVAATAEPAAATPPPGWYPDPVGVGRRWWSGLDWTEHVEQAPTPEDPQVDVPQRTAIRSTSSEEAVVVALAARSGKKDPYRDRQVISKFALALSLVSIVGVAARFIIEMPIIVQYIFAGAPMPVAAFAIYLAFRSDSRMRIPIVAGVIAIATAAVSTALDAGSAADTMSGMF